MENKGPSKYAMFLLQSIYQRANTGGQTLNLSVRLKRDERLGSTYLIIVDRLGLLHIGVSLHDQLE